MHQGKEGGLLCEPPPPKGVSKTEVQIRDWIPLATGFGDAGSGVGCKLIQDSALSSSQDTNKKIGANHLRPMLGLELEKEC